MSSHRRELLHLAWPATLTLAVRSLYRINDQFFVQDLGTLAQSAVAVGSMVAICLFAAGELLGVGNLAITARRLGEGNNTGAHVTIRSGLRLGLALGFTLAILTAAGRAWLSEWLIPGDEHAVERGLLCEYLLWVGFAQLLLTTMPVIESSFMAMKQSRIPMGLELLAVATNTLLNWQLVPRYGVAGAGIATCLSRVVPLCLGLWLLR